MFQILLLLAAIAADPNQPDFPKEVRGWYRNPDGSCVQCSIGMCGVWQNMPAASTLLWTSDYGPAVRGGSYPSRVEKYCDARQIPAYNVTGDATFAWMKWAVETGRMVAIGAGDRHFQTLVWYDPQKSKWLVCNNNSTQQIDEYTEQQFRNLHLASGKWVVVLKTPPPPACPRYEEWWK
jgi:hypothetical protein